VDLLVCCNAQIVNQNIPHIEYVNPHRFYIQHFCYLENGCGRAKNNLLFFKIIVLLLYTVNILWHCFTKTTDGKGKILFSFQFDKMTALKA